MQKNHLVPSVLLALATGAIVTSSAQAAITSYTNDDLFLGFRKEGSSNAYLINIGQASQYRDLVSGGSFTLNIGNIGADLNSIYPGWQNDPLVHWGVVGTSGASASGGDPSNLLYASKAQVPVGTRATAYDRALAGTQGPVRADILALVDNYIGTSGRTTTANSNVALNQLTSETNDWSDFNPGGQSFAYFDGLEGDFTSGVNGTALDLFRMQAGSGSGTYEGTFTINSTGAVTFTNVVPEPTSMALLGLGASVLGFVRRRRVVA